MVLLALRTRQPPRLELLALLARTVTAGPVVVVAAHLLAQTVARGVPVDSPVVVAVVVEPCVTASLLALVVLALLAW